MPLLYERSPLTDVQLAVWKITEEDDYFLERLPTDHDLLSFLPTLKGRRRTEWLASRWLCYSISQNGPIVKDSFGKPGFSEITSQHLSLSHTHGYTAMITAPFLVGIDIQTRVAKIQRLARKFLNEEEISQVIIGDELERLHIYWGAKESIYKAYGERQLDFRSHIHVNPFRLNGYTTSGVIKKGGIRNYQICFERWDDFILVYAMDMPV